MRPMVIVAHQTTVVVTASISFLDECGFQLPTTQTVIASISFLGECGMRLGYQQGPEAG